VQQGELSIRRFVACIDLLWLAIGKLVFFALAAK
jgi:hypothetical protein